MVIAIELRVFETDSLELQFFTKKRENAETLNTIVYQTEPLAKLLPMGSYLFMKYSALGENAGENENGFLCH